MAGNEMTAAELRESLVLMEETDACEVCQEHRGRLRAFGGGGAEALELYMDEGAHLREAHPAVVAFNAKFRPRPLD